MAQPNYETINVKCPPGMTAVEVGYEKKMARVKLPCGCFARRKVPVITIYLAPVPHVRKK